MEHFGTCVFFLFFYTQSLVTRKLFSLGKGRPTKDIFFCCIGQKILSRIKFTSFDHQLSLTHPFLSHSCFPIPLSLMLSSFSLIVSLTLKFSDLSINWRNEWNLLIIHEADHYYFFFYFISSSCFGKFSEEKDHSSLSLRFWSFEIGFDPWKRNRGQDYSQVPLSLFLFLYSLSLLCDSPSLSQ